MHRLPPLLATAVLALSLPLLVVAHENDVSKVNGSVHVAAGQATGNVSTVNGDVDVAGGAHVGEASTVNGSIEMGAKVQADKVDTVNGSVTLGPDSRVSGEVSAVNGHITLARAADVRGKLDNVNGGIELHAAHVAGGIESVSGDITVGADSRVEGGILVDKPSGWFHGNERTPTVVIGPRAVVQGALEFRREVLLKVSDSAQIGPVKGATVHKFSGVTP